MLAAILFDFDGTLAKLTLDFGLMRTKLAAVAGAFLDPMPDDSGLPILEWVDALAEEVERRDGQDLALEFHTRCRFVILDMEIKAAAQGELFPFVRNMLTELRGGGVKLGIVTRNCTPALSTVFPDASEYTDCVLPREAVPNPKPHPGHLLAALTRLEVAPSQSLMVGDHPMDVEAGRRAGTWCASVASGNTPLNVLQQAKPDFAEADCLALARLLQAKGMVCAG